MVSTEWAQCFSKEMLPIPLNGPTLLTDASNTLAWAPYCCQSMLLMITNGLITAVELTVTMGQLLFPRKAADSLIWAHCAAQVYCQWPRIGQLFHLTDAADARVWAHCCC